MIKIIKLNKEKLFKLISILKNKKIFINKEKEIIILFPYYYNYLVENFNEIYFSYNNKLNIHIANNKEFELADGDILIIKNKKIKKIITFA